MEGKQEHYFTHTLTDATIVDITAETVLATDESLDYRDHEVVFSLVYLKIKWEHVVAGTSGEDTWRKPAA
ncbi:Hcp1 family type VI secretion system effector [Candidatus Thiomargarita nelsonii]|uniref:Hcp1 family type VI secretion system effector n=1 Tax=Candidatus Thiomargarita nelsonii TaxID=1003181 RepID=A0A176RWK9_9GAMM|nr:Hcp1 family type VI secretion system effector [Candidatus Thiomargarita nelsonii]